MPPFDEPPFDDDYSDVALLLASAREWPSEEFTRELDGRVAQRFAPQTPAQSRDRGSRLFRLPRWAAGPAVALVAGAVAAVIVLGGGVNGGAGATRYLGQGPVRSSGTASVNGASGVPTARAPGGLAVHPPATAGSTLNATASFGAPVTASAPVAPGAEQIRSAQIGLQTANAHVDQVAQEVFNVVSAERGTVMSSNITAASSGAGGGYASLFLSVPTGNLETVMTLLSRLQYASVQSRTDSSQNVSNQYSVDQRQLGDAQALRISLLRQLQSAATQTAIDAIQAQLKLAEAQITRWQRALAGLERNISYSDVAVQINQNGPPFLPTARHGAAAFTLARAGHDALRVLIVSAGVALIALAVMVPLGLLAALLMWLWVRLRQRRRERALDSAA